jgi:exodeoxyribonuclease VII small subunit
MGVFLLSVNEKTKKKKLANEGAVSPLAVNEDLTEEGLDGMNDDLSFEEALRELEETVAALENGGVPLDKSLDLLKKGLALADRCETVLAEAELTIEQLTINEDGELISQALEEDEDGE